MVNTLLELVGFALIVAFGFLVWPPLALLFAGIALIVTAVVNERQPLKRGEADL